MKFYRIKHVRTGLFYKVIRGRFIANRSLSKKGKLYLKRPKIEQIGKDFKYKGGDIYLEDNWEVIEYLGLDVGVVS